MKFEKLFDAVTTAKTALTAAENAPALVTLRNLRTAFDKTLDAVRTAENMEKALALVTSAKSALTGAENAKETAEAKKAVKDAEEAVRDAEEELRDGLEDASQYEVVLYLVTVCGHSLDNTLSEEYCALRGNGTARGNQQYVQKLKEGVRFAVECLHYGLTVSDLENMLN